MATGGLQSVALVDFFFFEVFGVVNVTLSNYREGIDNDTMVWFNPIHKEISCNLIPVHSSSFTLLLERYQVTIPQHIQRNKMRNQ